MKKAKVHLNNGEVADINLMFDNVQDWLDSVAVRGIATEDSHFPYHSITYILFEDVVEITDTTQLPAIRPEVVEVKEETN